MAWSSPPTAVTGAVITAAFWNTGGRDNLNDLDRRTSPSQSTVITVQTTTSLSYTDLATVGPSVAQTIGATGKALVAIYAAMSNTAGQFSLMSYAVEGATTVAASDAASLQTSDIDGIRMGATLLHETLNSGSNTFKAKYRVSAASTGSFTGRRLLVTALGS